MNEVLTELLKIKGKSSVGIAGCLCTTVLSETLKKSVDKPIAGAGPLYSLTLRLNLDQLDPHSPRLELLRQQSQEEADFFNPDNVSAILRFIKKQYVYEHVVLATWDHGSGYAIFTTPDPVKKAPNGQPIPGKKAVVMHPDHHAPVHRLFDREALLKHAGKLRGKAHLKEFVDMLDENLQWLSPPRGLTMDHLRQAIKDSFGHVEVIFMRNCFMQMFDTGFALREVTDYLVACESLMYFAAYDYDIFLNVLEANADTITSAEVASAAILGFTKCRVEASIRSDTALFGNQLSYYDALDKCINRMTEELIRYAQGNKNALLRCRRTLTDIVRADYKASGFQLVDALLWFKKAASLMAGSKKYWDALQEFLVYHQQMVGDRQFVGKLLGGGGYRESGFSLYFPTYQRNIEKYRSFYELYYALKTPFRSEFTRYSCWDEFIGYLFLDLTPDSLV